MPGPQHASWQANHCSVVHNQEALPAPHLQLFACNIPTRQQCDAQRLILILINGNDALREVPHDIDQQSHRQHLHNRTLQTKPRNCPSADYTTPMPVCQDKNVGGSTTTSAVAYNDTSSKRLQPWRCAVIKQSNLPCVNCRTRMSIAHAGAYVPYTTHVFCLLLTTHMYVHHKAACHTHGQHAEASHATAPKTAATNVQALPHDCHIAASAISGAAAAQPPKTYPAPHL